eukprot:9114485-Karenia_brevis.AAC.2
MSPNKVSQTFACMTRSDRAGTPLVVCRRKHALVPLAERATQGDANSLRILEQRLEGSRGILREFGNIAAVEAMAKA